MTQMYDTKIICPTNLISKINVDPYMLISHTSIESWKRHNFPSVNFIDIYDFLVTRNSVYTHNELHAYKFILTFYEDYY